MVCKGRKKTSPQDWLTDALERDGGKIVGRSTVALAGMTGEISKVKDRLEDWETRKKRDWYRLRAVLVSADGSTWYHATAMASKPDLAEIERDFTRLLGSIRAKLEGAAAEMAKAAADAEKSAVLEQLKDNMERVSATRIAQSEEERRVERLTNAQAPLADIEQRFDDAVAEAGLEDKRDALRRIVMPTVSMTELDIADPTLVGLSRIGGGPDLAVGQEWPRNDNGFHLNFLAQVNLADLPDRPEILPEAGLISFFTGTDYTDWRVLYTPAGAKLEHRALPENAMDTAIAALEMVTWDSALARFVADGPSVDGLSVEADETGRLTFRRGAEPVMAFASEYEFSRSAQSLRLERSLSAPFGQPGTNNNPKAYADLGIDDPSDFAIAIGDHFRIGDGPQHQMFGITGVRDLATLQEMAADHADKNGWTDIASPDGWFILAKIASGGEADFSFSDHGDYIFMVNRNDATRGDFTRAYAFVESG